MEYTRSFKVIIERDTSKQTERMVYVTALEACSALLEMMTEEDRRILLDQLCMYDSGSEQEQQGGYKEYYGVHGPFINTGYRDIPPEDKEL